MKFEKMMKGKRNDENDINITTEKKVQHEYADNKNENDDNNCEKQIDIDWENLNQNEINNDNKTIKIKRFQAELKNFADDCTLEMTPL